jgi:adenylosuccinate synthase
MKIGLTMGELLDSDTLYETVENILTWKNLTFSGYGQATDSLAQTKEWLAEYGEAAKSYITDTTVFLREAVKAGKDIMFEAQLGSLRDIDYGIYPYTTSSQTLAAYAPIGAGVPGLKLDLTIGVMKAYSSCVGEGPFTAEFFGDEAHALREAGGEYGAATGRPRRVGAFDVVASRYGIEVQGADEIALTKLDVLSYMEKVPICVAYEVDGKQVDDFPSGDRLMKAQPVLEYLDGWKCDISKCRQPADLPDAAVKYVQYLEKAVGCKIKYVSVGAERDDYLVWS